MLRPSTTLPRARGPSSWQAIRASRRVEGGSRVGNVQDGLGSVFRDWSIPVTELWGAPGYRGRAPFRREKAAPAAGRRPGATLRARSRAPARCHLQNVKRLHTVYKMQVAHSGRGWSAFLRRCVCGKRRRCKPDGRPCRVSCCV